MRGLLLTTVLVAVSAAAAISQETPPRPAPTTSDGVVSTDPRRWEAHWTDRNKPPPGSTRKWDPLDVATIVVFSLPPAVILAFLAFWLGRAIRDAN